MDIRTYARATVCVGLLVAAATVAPSAASAGVSPTCTWDGQDGQAVDHEIGKQSTVVVRCESPTLNPLTDRLDVTTPPSKGDANTARGAFPEGGEDGYIELLYQATKEGRDQFSVDFVQGGHVQQSVTVITNNVPHTNVAPTCSNGKGVFYDISDMFSHDATTVLTAGHSYFADLECSDDDLDDRLTLSYTQAPTHGTGAFEQQGTRGPLVGYTPKYNGLESFTVRAFDGALFSNAVTRKAIVVGGADLPAASDGSAAPPTASGGSAVPPAAVSPSSRPAAPAATFGLGSVPSSLTADSGGNVTVPVSGTPGSKGTVSLTADAPKGLASAAAVAKKKTLSLASQSFTVPARGRAKVKVKLSGRAFKALKGAKKLRGKVTVKSGAAVVIKSVTFKAPKSTKHKAKTHTK